MPSTNTESILLPRWVLGLLVPADARRPVGVVIVPDNAIGLSDAIGGGLLEEICRGVLAGRAYRVYADEERAPKGLPPNTRADVLATRLGWSRATGAGDGLGLFGDLIIVGAATPSRDTDVPRRVLQVAEEAELLG